MKHTPAKVAYNAHTQVIWADIERNGNNPRICKVGQHDMSLDEMEANALLICEAFNTANETGKTPAQLAEANRELLAALQSCLNMAGRDAQLVRDIARAAIAKHQ